MYKKQRRDHIILTLSVIAVMACLTLMTKELCPVFYDLPALNFILLESLFVIYASLVIYVKNKTEETD